MKKLVILSALFTCFMAQAVEGCNECHDEKWLKTPAHIWIDSELHVDIVACVDCHSWKHGVDQPPMLPSQNTLDKYCMDCHTTPENLAKKMEMEQYSQMPN